MKQCLPLKAYCFSENAIVHPRMSSRAQKATLKRSQMIPFCLTNPSIRDANGRNVGTVNHSLTEIKVIAACNRN